MEKKVSKHLIFYDGECGLCDLTVQNLLKMDSDEIFAFAPLQGETAKRVLKKLPKEYLSADSLILLEDFNTPHEKTYLYGKGAFRICWLLGGFWRLLGWISFLPAFLYDWGYRLVARNRRFLFKDACLTPLESQKHRFLP